MSNTIQDVIEKRVTINASQEAVFEAISDPQKIINWFPDAVEGSMNPGDDPVFDFGEYGKNKVHIVESKPHSYFSYRWVPGSKHFMGDVMTVANTLVEFFIESKDESTVEVIVKESGFLSLPEADREQRFQDNTGGWDYMAGRLVKLFA